MPAQGVDATKLGNFAHARRDSTRCRDRLFEQIDRGLSRLWGSKERNRYRLEAAPMPVKKQNSSISTPTFLKEALGIVDCVLELPRRERGAFLDRAGLDSALREYVEGLVRSYDEAEGSLDRSKLTGARIDGAQ